MNLLTKTIDGETSGEEKRPTYDFY